MGQDTKILQEAEAVVATAGQYADWLEGFIAKGGRITDVVDTAAGDSVHMASKDFHIPRPRLSDNETVSIIVPNGLRVYPETENIDAIGGNEVYFMNSYTQHGCKDAGAVPVYADTLAEMQKRPVFSGAIGLLEEAFRLKQREQNIANLVHKANVCLGRENDSVFMLHASARFEREAIFSVFTDRVKAAKRGVLKEALRAGVAVVFQGAAGSRSARNEESLFDMQQARERDEKILINQVTKAPEATKRTEEMDGVLRELKGFLKEPFLPKGATFPAVPGKNL